MSPNPPSLRRVKGGLVCGILTYLATLLEALSTLRGGPTHLYTIFYQNQTASLQCCIVLDKRQCPNYGHHGSAIVLEMAVSRLCGGCQPSVFQIVPFLT